MHVIIGIDPHKASHTAVAVDDFETVIDEICIRSCPTQAVLLREWADGFRDNRIWAVAGEPVFCGIRRARTATAMGIRMGFKNARWGALRSAAKRHGERPHPPVR